MGTGEFYAGGNPAMDWHLIPSRFMLQKPETEIGLGFMDHLARIQTLPTCYGPGSTFLVFQEFVVCFTVTDLPTDRAGVAGIGWDSFARTRTAQSEIEKGMF